jgi:diamine N-acetyltransferase
MTSITKATEKDAPLLSQIATTTFIESHGHSAKPEDINAYITKTYSIVALMQELNEPKNIYHIIYQNEKPAGYAKIIFNLPHAGSPLQNITKLERLYVLQEFYNSKLGAALFQFNLELAKTNQQAGIWLYVWKENPRAINFYTKAGFTIIGSHDFKISATHTNPNHQMLLKF